VENEKKTDFQTMHFRLKKCNIFADS